MAELLALVFRSRPETLKSSETVRLEFVLRHSKMDDLIESLAERRVERLAYQGMRDLAEDLRKSLGFDLFADDTSLTRAIGIVESRNLIVHNRAIVNKRHVSKVPEAAPELGTRLDLTFDSVSDDLDFLAESAYAIDERAVAKWDLPASAYVPPGSSEEAGHPSPSEAGA